MKTTKLFFFLILILQTNVSYSQSSETLPLNDGWLFKQSNKENWKPATVPGSVQRDLIKSGELPDPYFGTNETKVQWVEKENWDYKKTFTVLPGQLAFDNAILSFEGLDTHAEVFLNGAKILQSQNMFVGHKISVKNVLKEGKNELYIRFYSPIEKTMPAFLTNGFRYPADNDHSNAQVSVYNRKAPYQFGWDWGIRIVEMGIWKPVSMIFYNTARMDDFYVKQDSVSSKTALLKNEIEIVSTDPNDTRADIIIGWKPLSDKGKASQALKQTVTLKKGLNKFSIPLTIENPKLWMPVGYGEQNLYDFTAQVLVGDKIISDKSELVGLRRVRLVQKPDEYGKTFYFEVNGIPVFAKGANYIPGEILRSQQDKTYYDRLFENITGANMNFIRVWGGGTYEDDYFYQLADEKGILIWQDFIFGCVPYPSDDVFLANVTEEVIYNIKRLRNHASLAFWCGNNEIEEGIDHWGWDKQYPAEVFKQWREGYDKTFRKLIPGLLNEFDGTRSYIHGSPYDSNWGNKETFASSDVHDWGLWHGRMPFEALADRAPRFASEFGFQSFPEMKTIRTFAQEKDFDINSEVMKTHQKSYVGNVAIKQYMDMYYHPPKNFEDFVYVGLIMQGNGMKEAIEANRRHQPYCMGALYWQLNDDWPVVSWSSIDYYNNWKPQHYKVRDVFAPLALGAEFKDNTLSFFTMSDKQQDVNGLQLNVNVIDFNGKILKKIKEPVIAKANTGNKVKTLDAPGLATEEQKQNCVVHAWLSDSKGKVISVKDYFFYWPNKLNLPETTIEHKIKYEKGKCTVTLFSKKLAKDVFIETPEQGAKFSDNFFDLLPGETKTIVITSPQFTASQKPEIKIKHLRMTY